ncbi:hypothetical protein MHC_02305 [Mycoplasma haemocanis str. Illinois]|uniref:Uncharacterized protein n=1 Tax=Mycoplasma haemocanis (strain Illinois) TaxID=1111676 RepID=H6N6Q5_MYCHN|nr:hypothetical protein [Mycoplasma haemocanis]AEW45327.1 hypothetical protein MHC_02305 [Mycoplasma haemocanis str. Illinois]
MQLTIVKFLVGGIATSVTTGLTAWGISSIDWKEKSKELPQTKDEISPKAEIKSSTTVPSTEQTSPSPSCEVFKIDNKGKDGQRIEKIDWKEKKKEDSNAETTNKNFWEDVEKACEGTDSNKPQYQGKVYVTETGGKWNYSRFDQKDWSPKVK